jgi:hypothetical protein
VWRGQKRWVRAPADVNVKEETAHIGGKKFACIYGVGVSMP